MGVNTAKSLRILEGKARKRKERAARRGDMVDAMAEQIIENGYAKRAAEHERPGAKGW